MSSHRGDMLKAHLRPPVPPHRADYSWRGFTLVEVIVTIGVIGLLLGITLPVLLGARESAHRVGALANARGLGVTIETYVQANSMRYPFPPREAGAVNFGPIVWDPDDNPNADGASVFYFSPVWSVSYFWPALMHGVAPWRDHYETWLSPGLHRDDDEPAWRSSIGVSFRYSNSFVASPSVWTEAGVIDAAAVRPVRASEVAHPSLKALMFDRDRAYLTRPPRASDPRTVLAADGSAALRLDADAVEPVENRLSGVAPRFYHDTPRGVLGVDF